jgi:hypothetical protein
LTLKHWRKQMSSVEHESSLYKASLQELLSSAKEYLPYMPISSAREGGAARHSGMVIASDRLKATIVDAEKLLANYEN